MQAPSGSARAPFLSNPVDCSKPTRPGASRSTAQEHAGALRALGVPDLTDPDWKTATDPAPPVTGCDGTWSSTPRLAVKPLQPGGGPVQADQPTGLAVDLDFPQTNDPTDPHKTPSSTPKPPDPAAQGHHRQAPGRARDQPLLGRRPRRLL